MSTHIDLVRAPIPVSDFAEGLDRKILLGKVLLVLQAFKSRPPR